ncbi:MAG: DUF1732 domain-containing protein [Candidatus Omnitrophica bacterium]|nr:DUF1732 domain-containing protein [Candidatus Omnitrophota bacterium]
MRCMSGFGKAELKDDKGSLIYCEIKGFNHKFLEVSFDLPDGCAHLESSLKKEIEKNMKRGKVMVHLQIMGSPFYKFLLNKELARSYFFLLQNLREELSIKENVKLETLINLPGVLRINTDTVDKNLEPKIKKTFRVALEKFLKNKEALGQLIYQEVKERCRCLQEVIVDLQKRSDEVIKQRANKIENPDEKVNFLNSRDITEELNLLKFLFAKLDKGLQKDSPIGKELDFIVQEIQREINTLSAKSFDPKIISYCITIKTQVERIREQIQNVE